MKSLPIILLSVFVSCLVSFVLIKQMAPAPVRGSEGKTTHAIYDRVMETKTINCGYALWPPFIIKDPNTGEMSGILVDIVTELGKSLDLKINWAYETGYGNYNEDLNAGRFDVMCATLWADAGRIKNSLLLEPFLYSGVYLVVRKGDTRFDADYNILNSEEFTLTGVDGDITATLADRLFPKAKKVNLPNTGSATELAENVNAKKADATFADLGFFAAYDKENPEKLKIMLDNPAWVFGERMAVKNGEIELKYVLDTAIAELTNSGKISEIMKKYPGTSTYPPNKDY